MVPIRDIARRAAFLLLLPRFKNGHAAGPHDGEWTGAASSTAERCKQGVVKFTVEGRVA
jgi:hypothetical protein